MLDNRDNKFKGSDRGLVSTPPLSSTHRLSSAPLGSPFKHYALSKSSATESQPKSQPASSRVPALRVRAGDTLWEIAQNKLGDGTRWRELQKADGSRFTGQEARHLQVGERVYLPGAKPTTKTYHPGNSSFETPNVPAQVVRTGNVTRRELTASTVLTKSTQSSASPISRRTQIASQQIVTGGITRRDRPNGYTHPSLNTKSRDSSDTKTNALLNGTVKGTAVGTFLVSRKLSPVPTEASRAAKPLVLKATLPDGSKSIKEIPLRRVRYSQATVSPTLNDKKTPLSKVVEGMRKHGWDYTKEPPDVVKFERKKLSVAGKKIPIQRSKYVTLDHRRLVAAKEAGIKKVPARVHFEHDPIRHDVPSKPGSAGKDVAKRFKLRKEEKARYTDPETRITHEPGSRPRNWGEAAKHRAANQRVRGYDNFPLKGQRSLPKISEPSASRAVKVLENSHVQGVARGASKVLAPVAIGLDAWQLKNAYQKDGFGKDFRKEAGSVAGGWGGAAAGAAIGSAFFPGVGTVVGGVIGGVAGSEFGDEIEQGAEKAGKAIAGGAKKAWNKFFG